MRAEKAAVFFDKIFWCFGCFFLKSDGILAYFLALFNRGVLLFVEWT